MKNYSTIYSYNLKTGVCVSLFYLQVKSGQTFYYMLMKISRKGLERIAKGPNFADHPLLQKSCNIFLLLLQLPLAHLGKVWSTPLLT